MPKVKSFKVRKGTYIGDYKVHECLGKGWEGEVYRVSKEYSKGNRVLKLFDRAQYRSKQMYEVCPKLEQMSNVQGVIRFHHAGYWEKHDCYYLVMEWLDGKPLDKIVGKSSLPLFKALRLMRDLLRTVKDCHETGYCVGDIHTGNIIITADDLPHIIDVDLGAKLTHKTSADDRATICKLFYEITDGPYSNDLRSALPKRRDAIDNRYRHTSEILKTLDDLMGRDSKMDGRQSPPDPSAR